VRCVCGLSKGSGGAVELKAGVKTHRFQLLGVNAG
jgi:hypothetical protein